jgi:hypothetical protein
VASVKSIPIQVTRRIATSLNIFNLPTDSPALVVTADVIIVAFFYPVCVVGDYTDSPSDTTPFTFQDVMLCIGRVRKK